MVYLIQEPSRSRSAIIMADGHGLKGEDPHISGNIKHVLLSRKECSASIVQPYLSRVAVATVENDVDISVGSSSGACSC